MSHKILLDKLFHYGIRGTAQKWFSSYLSNRRQYVAIDSEISQSLDITCGVPQGSILGPLLFIIYVNDLNFVSDVVMLIMFADDTNIFIKDKSFNKLINSLNVELEKIYMWLNTNMLTLNIVKTNYIIFGGNKNQNCPNLVPKINNVPIERVTETKFLGVIVDEKLHWKKHIDSVITKVSRSIGILYKARYRVGFDQLKQLYFTLIEPSILYCCIIWGQSKHSCQLDAVWKLQKKAVRVITFEKYNAASRPLFRRCFILNVYEIFEFQTLLFMYKSCNNMLPACFSNYFVTNSQIHDHFTRQASALHITKTKTTCRQSSISFQGPYLWNKIPSNIKNSQSLIIFKRVLREFLLSTE